MRIELSPIETERLILRPVTQQDVDDMHAYVSLPEVARYMFWEPMTRDETATRIARWIENAGSLDEGGSSSFSIRIKSTGEMIGDCGVAMRDAEARQAELGYSLHPQFQGHGYATEAVSAVVRLGFEQLNRHRIYARCDGRNDGSWKLMERLGMRREAHFREHAVFKGEWDDEYYYAILEDEWRAQQGGTA